MASCCCSFSQPARQINSRRKGSKVRRMSGEYHSETPLGGSHLRSSCSRDLLPFQEDRIFGHYGVFTHGGNVRSDRRKRSIMEEREFLLEGSQPDSPLR